MSLNWHNIKSFNNSQNNAFEELVCQLAREEEIEGKKDFYRVAAPDGGVEAYCVLDNDDEYGWQAKYFTSMGSSQWSQLKESFETTLRTHPDLKKYYICIPLDRQDPRREQQMWFMDKWNEKTQEWIQFSKEQGREISFEYWGSFELVHRLSQEKHAGRKLFWFSQDDFSDQWFEDHVKNSILNLGKRYTPELNVELEIAKNFDSISKNDSFRQFTKDNFHEFLVKINKALNSLSQLPLQEEINQINVAIENIETQFALTQKKELEQIDLNSLKENTKIIDNALSQCDRYLRDNEKKDSIGHTQSLLMDTNQAIYDFLGFINSPLLKLANFPITLLYGEAGIGKSHLLADVAVNRIKEKKSCILLLGQHFTSEESPWTQILNNLLRVDCNDKQLLGALNAKAEAQGERLLFFVDAINEGKGLYFWPEHINGFINEIAKYPWIGLVLSLRTSYKKLLIPDGLISEEQVTIIQHHGFEEVEFEASSNFFSQYGIEQPSIPLLNPEFSNPLFLKLFCEGLNRSGLTKIPKGYGGISSIIDFFIKTIDEKLSKPGYFDYPSGRNVIRRVINALVEYKLNNDCKFVPYEDAYDIADQILSKFSSKRRFLDSLISEGILSKNVFWSSKDEYEEGVYLAYERFEDHLTTAYLLDSCLESEPLESIFQEGGKLCQYIDNSYLNQGILESLSIQIPERTGKELYELLDVKQKAINSVIESFIRSLIWRKSESISEKTKDYVNEYVFAYEHTFNLFFQTVYSVCSDPEHFYNADSLHRFLMKLSMSDRDAQWTTYLHEQYYQGSAMFRLVNWAISTADKSYLSTESRLLSAKALAWLFTTTHIRFRDTATKALVVLLVNNLKTITKLLSEFETVNDPYVYERIFSAAYGAVLNSDNLEGINSLSKYIIETIFKKEEVYPNVLVRDYARNIVEYACYKGSDLGDIKLIRPPYKSHFSSVFPTNDEIGTYKFDYNSEDFKDYFWGQNSILSSMVTEYGRGTGGYGDFGRYTFQSAFYNWVDIDPNDLSNYACKLIFEEYGYDVEKHGQFDRHANDNISRHKNKKERIGKKYQWIALYEVLARVSDNYKIVDSSTRWGDEKEYVWYQGPWEPFVRNIDPTVIHHQPEIISEEQTLPCDLEYADWGDTHKNWLRSDDNLPKPEDIIAITGRNKDEWLVLEKHISWDEPVPLGQDKYGNPRKHLWYQIRSYLVKEDEYEKIINWSKTQNFMGRWFPEGHDQYQVFSREYYWSPAYNFFDSPYYGGYDWKDVCDPSEQDRVIAEVLPTSEGHIWESGSDYEEQPSYLAPRQYMFTGMNLQYSSNIGEWLNENGQVVCFDPSIGQDVSSALIVKKDLFLQFLSDNGLRVFWTCLGEKNILGGDFHGTELPNWLEISGVYTLKDSNVEGEIKSFTDE